MLIQYVPVVGIIWLIFYGNKSEENFYVSQSIEDRNSGYDMDDMDRDYQPITTRT